MVTPVAADTGDIIRTAAPARISSRIIFQNPDGLLLVCLNICKYINIYNIKSFLFVFWQHHFTGITYQDLTGKKL
jgi:hypothetical protein